MVSWVMPPMTGSIKIEWGGAMRCNGDKRQRHAPVALAKQEARGKMGNQPEERHERSATQGGGMCRYAGGREALA